MRNAAPVVLIALVAVGAAAFLLTPERQTLPEDRPVSALDIPPPADHSDHVHGEGEGQHTHDPASASGDRRGPNGMPIPDNAPVKGSADLEREAHPPKNDAEAWVGERAQAHRDWIEATARGVDLYAAREQLDADTLAAMQSSLGHLQDEIGEIRQAMESGKLHPIQGRQDITAARETAEAEISEILGIEEANNFRLEMMKRVPGGVI